MYNCFDPNDLLQFCLSATSPFQCVFFSWLFRHLTPLTPMSTRDPPDHCLAFWVPSSPSPTCHCPTRSLSAILTLCLPTRVQLVRCTNCMIFTLIENLIGYLTTSLQSCEIQLRLEHKFAGVFNCNTCRIYPS